MTRSSPAPASRATARSSTRERRRPWRAQPPDDTRRRQHPHPEPVGPRARRLHGLPGDLEGAEHAAHAADERHERGARDRRARRHHRARPRRRGLVHEAAARHRDRVRHDQRRRRLPRHRPHARDVQEQAEGAGGDVGGPAVTLATSFLQDDDFIAVLYIIAFSLFIYGLMGLTGPKTAVRGNRIAAVGMAIAVIATFLIPGIGNWGLIILGIAIGTAVGVPAARRVRMTAMPQMVALFNGVGGGAIALIAWSEFRHTNGYANEATYIAIFSLFSAIIGSVSFWGSNIAFGKLQEVLPGRPITIGRAQQFVNLALLAIAVGCAVAIVSGSDNELLMIVLLLAAAALGNLIVLPIGGADMPVVISLLNAFTGLSAAAAGIALNNTALIVAGMIVGASGSILTNLMAQAMNRSIPSIVAGGFGGVVTTGGGGDDGDRSFRSTSASDAAVQMAYASQVIIVPGYGMAVAQAQHAVREMTKLLEDKGVEVKFAIHPVAGRMPNPKTGTVTFDGGKAVSDAKAGKLEYRTDRGANVHVSIGKKSFDERALLENYATVLDEIVRAKPAAAKGRYIRQITITSTMGPGIRIDPARVRGIIEELEEQAQAVPA